MCDYLLSEQGPGNYLERLLKTADQYNGFNLIVGSPDELYWYSNLGTAPQKLEPGIYGLSTHLLDTPWPKVTTGKKAFQNLLSEQVSLCQEDFFPFLSDVSFPDEKDLPDTGIGMEWERILSAIFIISPIYGTRSTTLLFVDTHNRATFMERTFNGDPSRFNTVTFRFQIEH